MLVRPIAVCLASDPNVRGTAVSSTMMITSDGKPLHCYCVAWNSEDAIAGKMLVTHPEGAILVVDKFEDLYVAPNIGLLLGEAREEIEKLGDAETLSEIDSVFQSLTEILGRCSDKFDAAGVAPSLVDEIDDVIHGGDNDDDDENHEQQQQDETETR